MLCSSRRNEFWLSPDLMMPETTTLETTHSYRQKPTTKPKGDWRQTSTGGLISNSTEHMQFPLIWRGIQHLKGTWSHFSATEPWPIYGYLQAALAAVWRTQELHPDKPDTQDATLLRQVALTSSALSDTHLDWTAFVFFSTTSRILWQSSTC